MAVMTPSLTTAIVSEEGTATPTARCTASAATQSAMIRWSTSGRAASWNSTSHSSPPSASMAHRVDSTRDGPPAMTPASLR